METEEKLRRLYSMRSRMERLIHCIHIIDYDMETSCPVKGMDDDSKDSIMLQNQLFQLEKSKEYTDLIKDLHDNDMDRLGEYDRKLVHDLYKDYKRNEHVDEALNEEANTLFSKAYLVWLDAKEKSDYGLFSETLEKIYEMQKRLLLTRDDCDKDNLYNTVFSDYEEGFTTDDLDRFFDELEKGIVPLIQKVKESGYQPRCDFLSRRVPLGKQSEFTTFLLKHNGFDLTRGSISTTEHPFTSQIGQNDVRVTTKYFENNFISNMYSIIHEGGHAIFGQNVPDAMYRHHVSDDCLTMAKHESVSRFYENVIGRSREYISSIYPEFHRLFKEELGDVSIGDFYEGVNRIDFDNRLRTEADELTYSIHILIRYRLERKIMKGEADFRTLNLEWNRLYREYLGLDIRNDKEGILQDVHWSSGFGYFPTYALGNALNCIYVKKMKKELDFEKTLSEGRMDIILNWMKENVFFKAPLLNTKDWIRDITGEEFSAKPYIEYLTDKFTEIYHLK